MYITIYIYKKDRIITTQIVLKILGLNPFHSTCCGSRMAVSCMMLIKQMIIRIDEIVGFRRRLYIGEGAHEHLVELSHLDSLHVTPVAEKRLAQRIGSRLGLVAQLCAAILTHVTLDVKVLFHRYDSDCLVCSFRWRY